MPEGTLSRSKIEPQHHCLIIIKLSNNLQKKNFAQIIEINSKNKFAGDGANFSLSQNMVKKTCRKNVKGN